jgi:outer membrane receptor protein involved in Fe transport
LSLSDGSSLENSGYNETKLFSKFIYSHYKFSLEHSVKTDNNPTDPSLNPPANDDNFSSLLSDSIRIKNDLNVEFDKNKLSGNVYVSEYREEKKQRESKEIEKRSIQTIGLNLKKEIKHWTLGAEGVLDELEGKFEERDVTAYPNATSSTANLYIQRNIKLSKLTLSPGLKYSTYSLTLDEQKNKNKSGSAFLKKLSTSYKISKDLEVSHSYSEGYNPPRVNEVYPSGLHARGDDFFIKDNFFIQNLDLKAEQSKMHEMSLNFNILNSRNKRLSFTASAYENKIQDYILLERIDRSVIDEGNGTTQFINSPRVSIYGSELKLNYIQDNLEASVSHSQVRGRDEKLDLYLEDLPADQYQYRLKIYLDQYGMSFGYHGIQSLEQNRVNPETIQRTDPTNSSFIHNVFAEKSLGQYLKTSLRVDNLGDNKYRRHGSHLYETKQDIKLMFKYKINTL